MNVLYAYYSVSFGFYLEITVIFSTERESYEEHVQVFHTKNKRNIK